MKTQKCLSNYDLVPFGQNLRTTRQQPAAAVQERPVGRTEIFDHMNAAAVGDPGMAARDFGIGVVGVEVHVRKYAIVGVPPADVRLFRTQPKFGVGRVAALDQQSGMSSFVFLWFDLLSLFREFEGFFRDRRHADRSHLSRAQSGKAWLGRPQRLGPAIRFGLRRKARQPRSAFVAKARDVQVIL